MTPSALTSAKAPGRHPVFARFYARISPLLDRGVTTHRHKLLAGLSGRVVEIGAGAGSNFAHYPGEVTTVMAVEPEPHLRRLADAAAKQTAVPIDVIDAVADHLPAEDNTMDAAVVSLVLCTVPDPLAALAEIYRVLRPGGELRFFEHIQAATPARQRLQHLADATLWPVLNGGCHTGRDTLTLIERAGFKITELNRLGPSDTGMPFPAAPQVLGIATRPGPRGAQP
jgi:ubiquinone/menaquinone biosynthesis C-methylase UbiE